MKAAFVDETLDDDREEELSQLGIMRQFNYTSGWFLYLCVTLILSKFTFYVVVCTFFMLLLNMFLQVLLCL